MSLIFNIITKNQTKFNNKIVDVMYNKRGEWLLRSSVHPVGTESRRLWRVRKG